MHTAVSAERPPRGVHLAGVHLSSEDGGAADVCVRTFRAGPPPWRVAPPGSPGPGAGRDLLLGGAGLDRLLGLAGRDRAVGGAGSDVCRVELRSTC